MTELTTEFILEKLLLTSNKNIPHLRGEKSIGNMLIYFIYFNFEEECEKSTFGGCDKFERNKVKENMHV